MEPRMKKYGLTKIDSELLLIRSETGVIATLNNDGSPYALPVNYIYLEGKIYIHGRAKGQKISNIMKDPRCSFTVFNEKGYNYEGETACDTETDFESVVVQGTARILEDHEMKSIVLRAIADKYGREGVEMPMERVAATGVIEVTTLSMTGKYHQGP